ncbi:FkbM family methyltransferase [Thalassospira lucentensis]|uniref:FkbM family methyltransferase n=1 Tax=Thalassospira lucentensis TaxID=168935 RepID=UPI002942C665|nr:FkbM family methyltransferase [Thalassospira lucentensis]WOI11247.1 FkbM family methyltransferase [Thalassospira lucentensis]
MGIYKKIKKLIGGIIFYMANKFNGPYVNALMTHANGMNFLVSPFDMAVGRHLRWRGKYGTEELNLIKKVITNDMECLFVGTHIGAIALPVSFWAKHSSLIEANPDTFCFLQANVRLNCINNVSLYNFAAGESDGEINFIKNIKNSGGSKREPVNKMKFYYDDGGEVIKVPLKKLDDVFPSLYFDFIFMDIEGSEYFALKGMQRIISQASYLVVEFVPHHLKYVSGVSVEELLLLLEHRFMFLFIPSTSTFCEREAFSTVLGEMYRNNQADDGIIFSVEKPNFI